jgi:predicted metalloprotease with PDZ domain
VLSTPGRRVQSLARASWDAWIKYYRPDENSANATVSYYAKGSLVGLCLDLRLRQHGHGLDELMRALYALARPITERDILDATQGLSDASVARELREWVQGTDDLPLKDLLADVGVEWREQEPSVSQRLGCRLQETPAGLKAQQVLRGGAAQSAGLAAGDELLALDDWRVRKSDDLHLLLRPGKRHALTVARDQRLLQLRLHVPERTAMAAATSVQLELSAHANAALLARRDAWLARA